LDMHRPGAHLIHNSARFGPKIRPKPDCWTFKRAQHKGRHCLQARHLSHHFSFSLSSIREQSSGLRWRSRHASDLASPSSRGSWGPNPPSLRSPPPIAPSETLALTNPRLAETENPIASVIDLQLFSDRLWVDSNCCRAWGVSRPRRRLVMQMSR